MPIHKTNSRLYFCSSFVQNYVYKYKEEMHVHSWIHVWYALMIKIILNTSTCIYIHTQKWFKKCNFSIELHKHLYNRGEDVV